MNNEEVNKHPFCGYCGVPYSQHGSACGWDNANVIFFPWEHTAPAYISAEEKELRWTLANMKNGFKIAATLFTASPLRGLRFTSRDDDDLIDPYKECDHVFDCATCNGKLTCKKCNKSFECK